MYPLEGFQSGLFMGKSYLNLGQPEKAVISFGYSVHALAHGKRKLGGPHDPCR